MKFVLCWRKSDMGKVYSARVEFINLNVPFNEFGKIIIFK